MGEIGTLYIDGAWSTSSTGETLVIRDPSSQDPVGEVSAAGRDDTRSAIRAAANAFPAWAARSGAERAPFLLRVRDLLLEHRDGLAATITAEMGKPLREAWGEVGGAAGMFEYYAEEGKRVGGTIVPSYVTNRRSHAIRQPVGVVAAITPWNFPLATVAKKLAPALAAGCTVLLKPAEATPTIAVRLFELFERAGLPAGVANLVTGLPSAIGEEILSNADVRLITFTGSTRTGKHLMKGAADTMKRIALELGGHAPFIVFEDAVIDDAVQAAYTAKFRNAGQVCVNTNRLFVHESIADDFVAALKELVESKVVGPGADDATDIGPLVNEAALHKALEHIEDARTLGAQVVTGGHQLSGGRFEGGYYCAPTILRGAKKPMRIMSEETFGPVLPVTTFTTDDEAIALANDSSYGLAAYVFTQDARRCFVIPERLAYGSIRVNNDTGDGIHAPFGGVKESGIGLEGGPWGLDTFLVTKSVSYQI
ncbi:MAG: NAD-dependent succinate-semialdehyde dehydrogenase [Trueperaceae bacterium]|nr:NAD-dependent succinate-semialdehyde dehydrogenase [Trueperaceae bacterium]